MAATLADALKVATQHWEDRPGGKIMVSRARTCVNSLGADLELASLGPQHGVELLADLRGRMNLTPKSASDYYRTFTRLLALNGIQTTTTWPKPPTVPRVKSREPMKEDDLDQLIAWFEARNYPDTADLARLLRATGLRVGIEGLTEAHLQYEDPEGDTFGTLTIIGKGGHERVIPVVDPATRALLRDRPRLEAVRRVAYRTHVQRWKRGVGELGIKTKLATPHAVRHQYACSAYAKSGGDIVMVQELLGHTDPKTTARYLHGDLSSKAKALGL